MFFFYVLIFILFPSLISILFLFASLFSYPFYDGFVFPAPHVDEKDVLPVRCAIIKIKKFHATILHSKSLDKRGAELAFVR